MKERKITLDEMLACREKRVERQKEMLLRFGTAIVSVTLVWPGELKDTDASRYVMKQALRTLEDALDEISISPMQRWCEFSATGAFAIYSVECETSELKKICVTLEDAHPLGRLWDFDVIDSNSQPISRSDINLPVRRCLLCNEPAHACVRSRAHDMKSLLLAVQGRIDEFKHTQQN
ncbi:citrate lyase holo-[acyl-carrier protein] synthase [Citrobacter portucalensis]|uniref:citrate lyase holo-[acyl-carrier protein] synthase n=1 Tax=Citrobacter portucalensis TaxID=1639133 RepID=UPI0022432AC9|nr:citrate lyase holo-[acyl-carrier protein] synthase [Citrobacter portucalensis]MCW8353796.1 citrate lyase holo-[acyl-carrier protein] synthase [Citrobacter portucalensis]MCX8992105.1 citrate lyase holo-[acyl-carrier protein] synthase [Citrobacter portucalensis]MCX9006317.1 citrate lyase holo-[acyl-carrier protein] synthase [Citrobacter portucalensis]MCX9039147.1 citrate lyase holo-[acyl-carrier protein] synthase [Citrobacter portucalensis]MCX9053718.1 citrate lyase holo-[acyl-carrier protein